MTVTPEQLDRQADWAIESACRAAYTLDTRDSNEQMTAKAAHLQALVMFVGMCRREASEARFASHLDTKANSVTTAVRSGETPT